MTSPNNQPANPGDQVAPGTEGAGENICDVCRGTGKDAGGSECKNCGGTGKVMEGIGGG